MMKRNGTPLNKSPVKDGSLPKAPAEDLPAVKLAESLKNGAGAEAISAAPSATHPMQSAIDALDLLRTRLVSGEITALGCVFSGPDGGSAIGWTMHKRPGTEGGVSRALFSLNHYWGSQAMAKPVEQQNPYPEPTRGQPAIIVDLGEGAKPN